MAIASDYSERALYSVTEGIAIDGEPLAQHRLAILKPGQIVEVTGGAGDRAVVIGGEPVGQRYKWWNLVSSRRDRIEQAQSDWQAGAFAAVPGETDFIPLPEEADWVASGGGVDSPRLH